MATTSLKAEAARLVASVPGEAAQPQVYVGGVVAHHYPRHRRLLEYVKALVIAHCPSYLSNDVDDVAQTVLVRLTDKLGEIETKLADCCECLARRADDGGRSEILRFLPQCLDEVEKACDRKRFQKFKKDLRRCITWASQDAHATRPEQVLELLRTCLAWLEKRGGKEVFAKSYIWKGVHWAILDARKRFIRKAEVSPQEREDEFFEQGMPHGESSYRPLEIRDEISDCLARLDDDKRFATFLALIGYRCSEIAELLDLSIPQAESRIRRGKTHLRDCLDLKGVTP